jgi:hypothetical protein
VHLAAQASAVFVASADHSSGGRAGFGVGRAVARAWLWASSMSRAKALGGGVLRGAAGGGAGFVAEEAAGGRFSLAPALHARRHPVRQARVK